MKKNEKSHITLGDKVKVIAGNQKGIIGNIVAFFPKKSIVFLDGIPPRIKKLKNSQEGKSEEKKIPVSIHVSNVMLWDIKNNQSSRIGYKLVEGKKQRYYKKSNSVL